jgi:hypothetical protein
MIVERLSIPEGRAAGEYTVTLLKGNGYNSITPEKIRDLWREASKHKVLFSDYTDGQIEPFIDLLFRPDTVFFEVYRDDERKPVGLLFVDQIIPRFDARGHFAFWDSIAGGREPLVEAAMRWTFETYGLKRMTAEIPDYQKGTLRAARRLGFQKEGVRRSGVIYKGDWADEILFGILKEEFENGRD